MHLRRGSHERTTNFWVLIYQLGPIYNKSSMKNKSLQGLHRVVERKVETMLGNGQPGRDVEQYTFAVKSEYHIEHRPVEVDTGQGGGAVTLLFSFIVNAANVVVARKNNDFDAYGWIRKHTLNNVG